MKKGLILSHYSLEIRSFLKVAEGGLEPYTFGYSPYFKPRLLQNLLQNTKERQPKRDPFAVLFY